MHLKPGVRIDNLHPEMVHAITILDRIYQLFGYTLVITSGNDGKHMDGSLHYANPLQAVDTRINFMSHKEAELIARIAKELLGSDFDVVLEPNHLHVEYQPK